MITGNRENTARPWIKATVLLNRSRTQMETYKDTKRRSRSHSSGQAWGRYISGDLVRLQSYNSFLHISYYFKLKTETELTTGWVVDIRWDESNEFLKQVASKDLRLLISSRLGFIDLCIGSDISPLVFLSNELLKSQKKGKIRS